MPLFPGSSVPASMRKSFDPGVHINTTPVLRPPHTSWKVLPGSMSTVATRAPSLNAATLLAASFSGSSTHPVHVKDLDGLASAMVRGVQGVSSCLRRTQAQAVQHHLLRIGRPRTTSEPGFVCSRTGHTGAEQTPRRLCLRVDKVQPTSCCHAAGDQPARTRNEHEILCGLQSANEAQST